MTTTLSDMTTPFPARAAFRCRLGLHPWPKWGAEIQATIISTPNLVDRYQGILRTPVKIQERVCPGCNRIERRRTADADRLGD